VNRASYGRQERGAPLRASELIDLQPLSLEHPTLDVPAITTAVDRLVSELDVVDKQGTHRGRHKYASPSATRSRPAVGWEKSPLSAHKRQCEVTHSKASAVVSGRVDLLSRT
jgi:hypothetical protein